MVFAVPIAQRPATTISQWIQLVCFGTIFNLGILAIHALQLLILPLHLHPATLALYNHLVNWTKDLFGQLLILISAIWAPTVLRITVDDGDDELDLKKIVRRDPDTDRIIALDLPQRMILMANHQVCLHFSTTDSSS